MLKRRLAQLLVAAPGIAFVWLSLHGALSDYRHVQYVRQRAAARTAVAEGTIGETHGLVAGKGHRTLEGAGYISFVNDAGEPVTVHYSNGFSGHVGDKLTVRYDPRHPDNYSLGGELFDYPDLLKSNSPFFFFGLSFLILAWKLGRQAG
jgi:hypothetical protein